MSVSFRHPVGAAATALALAAGLVLAGPQPAEAVATRPTAETTGVTAGRTLTALAGGTVATSGVIADRVITGDVTFTGSSLTLRNVRVTGSAIFRGDNLVIEDSELGALSLSGTQNVRVSRVEITGAAGSDGIHVTSDSGRAGGVLLEDTWVHNPLVTATSHYDGLQVRGVDGLTLRRVAIDLGPHNPQHNAALFLENANGGNRTVVVEDSWILGGGYAFYAFATDVAVRRTTFGGARWGNLYPQSEASAIVEFADNRDPNGTVLGLRAVGGAYQIVPVDPVDRAQKSSFVEALYLDFVGRTPSAAEVLHWVSRLDLGTSRYEVATALSRTDTWITAVVTRFYRDTLGRDPDPAGLAGWVQAVRSGTPVTTIASCFYGSDEYLAVMANGDLEDWVTDLYRKLLFRAPDAGGVHSWLGAMARGTDRPTVALSFYQADETSIVRVDTLYVALLGRHADSVGLAGWPAVVRAQGDLVLAAYLAASEEYYARAQQR